VSLEEIRKELEKERGSVEIKMPDKTIKVEVHFWTNNVSGEEGKKCPRSAGILERSTYLRIRAMGLKNKKKSRSIHFQS